VSDTSKTNKALETGILRMLEYYFLPLVHGDFVYSPAALYRVTNA
jgi:hypothetical protein